MLTWNLGYFWSLPRGVSPRLEWGHARALSSRAVTAVSRFPWRGSRDLWLSHEAFPQGFPTRLSHKFFPRVQGRDTIPRVPQMSQSIPGNPVFPALPRLSNRGSRHTTVARGTALWESLVGKPHVKASRETHRSLHPRKGKRDTAATAREESERACPHSRRGLTPLGRLQKYPKIHVCTGEESSGSGSDSTQGLRPRHQGRGIPRCPLASRMGTCLS